MRNSKKKTHFEFDAQWCLKKIKKSDKRQSFLEVKTGRGASVSKKTGSVIHNVELRIL